MTETVITFIYGSMGIISLIFYLPQIVQLIKHPEGSHSISLMTWGVRSLSALCYMLYAALVLADPLIFCLASGGFVGYLAVTVLAMRGRKRQKTIYNTTSNSILFQ